MSDDVISVDESLSTEVEGQAIIEPVFNGYQLIGDSQFLRFSESVLNLKRKVKDGFSLLGLCVSGQKIEHLLSRVRTGIGNVSEKVVLMIGTNDLLRGTSFEKMRDDLNEFLRLISENTKKIILLTLPPVPKLEKSRYHWDRLKKYNELIQKLHDDEKVFVGNAYAEFVYPKESLDTSSSTSSSNLANCRKNLESTFSGDSAENENEVSLLPSPSKRIRWDFQWQLNDQSNSIPQNMHSSHDPVSLPSGGVKFPSDEATSPSDCVKSPSCDVTSPCGDATYSFDETTSPSGDMMTTFCNATTSSGNVISADVNITLDGAASHSGGAVSSFDGISSPSCDATAHSDSSTTLSSEVPALSGGAMKPPDGASSPSDDAISVSGGAVLPFDDAPLHSGDETTHSSGLKPSSNETVLSGGTMTPSGGASSPSGNATLYSGGGVPSDGAISSFGRAISPSDYATPSLSDSITTPASGKDDAFANPSKKKRRLKRKRNSYSRGDNHNSESTNEIKIQNADVIRDEYFEKYYDNDCRRPDLIHLNAGGLLVIERIIRDIIDTLDVGKSQV